MTRSSLVLASLVLLGVLPASAESVFVFEQASSTYVAEVRVQTRLAPVTWLSRSLCEA